MPMRPSKVCGHGSCGLLAKSGSRYCDKHNVSGWGRWQQERGTDTQRGYGWQWRKLRRLILERDNHLCQEHLRQGKLVPATDVDHVVSKASGGTDSENNLQSLCRACHQTKGTRARQ